MKKLILSLTVLLLASAGLCAQETQEMAEVDGIWYALNNGEARITAKPDGSPYTGTVTIRSSVTFPDGNKYPVNTFTNAFNESEVEEIIFDRELFDVETNKFVQAYVRLDEKLETLRFNYLLDSSKFSYLTFTISTGASENCVNCYYTEDSEEVRIKVEKFNVYGPDGELLRPALYSDRTGEIVYPDENNIFHLPKDFLSNDQYAVLPIAAFACVNLAATDGKGNVARIRTEPKPWHSGLFTTVDGVTYEVNSYKLTYEEECRAIAAITAINPDEVPEDLSLPETIRYEGADYSLSYLPSNCFSNLPTKSVTLPSTITYMESYPFDDYPLLERVDLSAITQGSFGWIFNNCPALSEVILPQPKVSLSSVFKDCPAMQYLEIYPDGKYSNLAGTGTGLFDANGEWRDENTFALNVNRWGFHYMDGTPVPFSVFKFYSFYETDYSGEYPQDVRRNVYYDAEKDGDSYLLKRDYFYNPDPHALVKGFIPEIIVGVKSAALDDSYLGLARYLASESSVSAVCTVSVDENLPAEYFNLQGVRIPEDRLAPGIYIERRGASARKMLVK